MFVAIFVSRNFFPYQILNWLVATIFCIHQSLLHISCNHCSISTAKLDTIQEIFIAASCSKYVACLQQWFYANFGCCNLAPNVHSCKPTDYILQAWSKHNNDNTEMTSKIKDTAFEKNKKTQIVVFQKNACDL